jgi:LysM repeat protein
VPEHCFAKTAPFFMMAFMKIVFWLPVACACFLALPSCQSGGMGPGPSAATGPFDSNGNYREDWADNPSKWRKASDAPTPHELRTDVLPEIAVNDQPPANSNPLPPKSTSKPLTIIPKSQIASASSSKPKTLPKTTSSSSTASKSTTKSKTTTKTASSKPKSTRYVVKSGDSLSAIASRNGTSVSAIQRANGISGTLIRPGQSLTIPKK